MKIGIDISPLSSGHKVRGVGFYVQNLKSSLITYFPQNEYVFFSNRLDEPVDIVHYPYFDPFFITFPLRKKVPTVITVHDLIPLVLKDLFPIGVKGNLKWNMNKIILKSADAIIADSQSSKNDIVKLVGVSEKNVHVVHLAAGEEFKRIKNYELEIKSLKEKYNLPDRFVLYVGDVTRNKNLVNLVDAIEKINLPLVMVGKALTNKKFDKSNPWNQDLVFVQEQAEKNKNIHLLGFIPQEDLVGLYNTATVFVLPSLYEGFGFPVLEAMQCGCPVVTTKQGSLREVAGDAAHFVDPKDIDSIAKGIEEVFYSKKLQDTLQKKGLIQAKKFSWEKTAEETVKIYEELSKR